ncbi:MAG: alpha-(1-_3)-arabinofuranosyltransferase family protein [Acidimicrobiales bacterium]
MEQRGHALNEGDANQRILVLPGADFSAFRWGNVIDHILPGIVERPVAVRELIPYGSAASADLLIALDRRAQERLLEPAQIGRSRR